MKIKKPIFITAAIAIPVITISAALTDNDGFRSDSSNSVPNGSKSMALGTGNTADDKSLAVGINNIAYKVPGFYDGRSLAVGSTNTASQDSLAVGTTNIAYFRGLSSGQENYANYYSTSLGRYNETRRYSFAAGYSNIVNGGTSAIGHGNTSTKGIVNAEDGKGIVLIGTNNFADLKSANPDVGVKWNVLIGEGNVSDVDNATVLGKGNVGVSGTVVVGNYNEPNDPELTNATVVLSAGTSNTDSRNGLIIKNNGDVIVPKVQGDISMGVYE